MAMLLEPDVRGLRGGASRERCPTPSPPGSPGPSHDSCSIAPLTPSQSPRSDAHSCPSPSFSVVVAIDLGTTGSGYAFSFRSHPDTIHIMRPWEGGDPGVSNHKSPTCLLLRPDGSFHSFGYGARDAYHRLQQHEAKSWVYLERFKMEIHGNSELSLQTQLEAVNGRRLPALEVFAHSLRFLKQRALQELREHCPELPESGAIRWVLTVPAIWKQPAKQLMREAAYRAGLVSPESPEQLLIALEPEAASIYCRKLRLHQVQELSREDGNGGDNIEGSFRKAREQLRRSRHSRTFVVESGMGELWAEMQEGDRYIVADCGGGSVDLTVHQIERPQGTLKEIYKATGGPFGAVGVDAAFLQLLCRLFGSELMRSFRLQRPAAWLDLGIAFEARKRAAAPTRGGHVNIALPFSFIDFYRQQRGHGPEAALRRSDVKLVKWSSQGMLRLSAEAMNELFQPTVSCIVRHIESLLRRPEVRGVKFMFLVGGFADSAVLQRAVRAALGSSCRLLVPHDVALSTLKGAVLFGLDPGAVRVRRCPLTYGVGVLNKFIDGKHPREKLLLKDGRRWCSDVFDTFVGAEQSVALGELVRRSYCPARAGQRRTVIDVYSCARERVEFVTEPGVTKCATLSLELPELPPGGTGGRREIRAEMQFGDTEIKVTAMDVSSATSVRATIDFLGS